MEEKNLYDRPLRGQRRRCPDAVIDLRHYDLIFCDGKEELKALPLQEAELA